MKNLIFILFIIFTACLITFSNVSGAETCPDGDGWTKIENSSPSFTSLDLPITKVCVKGGLNLILYEEDTNDGCYSVVGINTSTSSAGEGRECKDISHASFYVENPITPTPTSGVTPTINLTTTPTIKMTPTVIVEPTTEPTLTPQPTSKPELIQNVTPEPTLPSVEEQIEELKKELIEAYGEVPEMGFK